MAGVADGGGRGGRLTALEHLEIPIGDGIGGDLVLDAVATGPADGPAVVLLHGFPQSSHEWRKQVPALAAAGYRVVAPDQRGYSAGARPDAVEAYHVDHLVADVLAVIDHAGGGPVHLVGHDWGAIVAWLVAGRHPELLRSLTAVSVGHPLALAQAIGRPGSDQAARSAYVRLFQQPRLPERLLLAGEGAGLRALFANTAFADRTAMEVYVSLLLEPGALTGALNWYRALDVATLAGIGTISVPTLYVWSTDDPALGREAAEGTAAYMTGPYQFVELEGISHWIPEDGPDELNRLLLAHLARHGSNPRK